VALLVSAVIKKRRNGKKPGSVQCARVSAVAARIEGAVLLVSVVVKKEKASKKEQEMR
jgi:hypothetical protein